MCHRTETFLPKITVSTTLGEPFILCGSTSFRRMLDNYCNVFELEQGLKTVKDIVLCDKNSVIAIFHDLPVLFFFS